MYTNWFRYPMGALIIIIGLHQMEVFHFISLRSKKTMDLEPTNRRMSCQLFSLVLALVLVGRLVSALYWDQFLL